MTISAIVGNGGGEIGMGQDRLMPAFAGITGGAGSGEGMMAEGLPALERRVSGVRAAARRWVDRRVFMGRRGAIMGQFHAK